MSISENFTRTPARFSQIKCVIKNNRTNTAQSAAPFGRFSLDEIDLASLERQEDSLKNMVQISSLVSKD